MYGYLNIIFHSWHISSLLHARTLKLWCPSSYYYYTHSLINYIYHCIISTHTSSVRYLGIWFSSICPHLWVELQITHFFLSAAVVATMFVTAVTAFSMMIFLGCFVISHSNSFWFFSVFCHLWVMLNISDFFLCAAAPSAVFATAMNISSMDII